MARGWNCNSVPSSAPVSRRSASLVKTPSSTAVSRTLDDQKENAVCRMADGLSRDDDMGKMWPTGKLKARSQVARALAFPPARATSVIPLAANSPLMRPRTLRQTLQTPLARMDAKFAEMNSIGGIYRRFAIRKAVGVH